MAKNKLLGILGLIILSTAIFSIVKSMTFKATMVKNSIYLSSNLNKKVFNKKTDKFTSSKGYTYKYFNSIGKFTQLNQSLITKSHLNLPSEPIIHNPQEYNISSNNFLINNANNRTVMYISEFNINQLTACNLEQRTLSNCYPALTNLSGPENLIVVANTLYLVNMGNSTIINCELNQQNGQINNCNIISSPVAYPIYISYYNQQIYLANYDASITAVCDIVNNSLSCSSTKNIPLSFFIIYYSDNYQYLINNKLNNLSKCLITESSTCTNTNNPLFDSPISLFIKNNYAYISNSGNNSIVSCQIQLDGNIYDCQSAKTNLHFPVGIASYTLNESL